MNNIGNIYEEFKRIDIFELKEFYKTYVPIFNITTSNLRVGNFHKDIRHELDYSGLQFIDDLDTIMKNITKKVPHTFKGMDYEINTMNTSLVGGLSMAIIYIDRSVDIVDDQNSRCKDKRKQLFCEPYYNITDDNDDYITVVDLNYIHNRLTFQPIFYIMRGLIDFMLTVPEYDIHIDEDWDDLEIDMVKSLMAADILYGDSALYILEETLLSDPSIYTRDKNDYEDIIEDMWEFFDTHYSGKYNSPDIIELLN